MRKSGEKRGVRLATARIATSAATRTAMPARISRGLSRNGRRGGRGGGAGALARRASRRDRRDGRRHRPVLASPSLAPAWPSTPCVQQVLQLVHELADVAEMPIDRREAHVGHLVELLSSSMTNAPMSAVAISFSGRSCSVASTRSAIASSGGDADRPLLARLQQPADQLLRDRTARACRPSSRPCTGSRRSARSW